jgi:hypothetical protein
MLLLVLSPKILNFIPFLLFLNLFTSSKTGSKLMKEINSNISLTYKTLYCDFPSYLHSLLSLKRNCSTNSSALVTLNRSSKSSRLKITNRSFHHTAPALWYSLPLTYVNFYHSTSSQPNLNSPVISLSTSVFLKNSNLISFTFLFLLSFTARLPLHGYLRN